MAGQIPPLYGRFEFPAVEEFLRRLKQVSAAYMGAAEFSAYLTTHNKESFYGLDYSELGEAIQHQEGLIKSIASSCSGADGRSVNVNVRFPKKENPGEAQFVIVTPSRFESRQIQQMLLGTWEEKSLDLQVREQAIGGLMNWLLEQAEEREARRREEAAKRRREEAAKLAAAAKAAKAAQARQNRSITTVRDKFHFDDSLPAEHLIKLLENISHRFLGNAPFNIRLITRDGQPYSNIGLKGLLRFFEKRRSMVLKLFMDAATPDGELVDLMLAFGPMARHLNAEVEITTRHTKEIQTLIRKSLEHNRSYVETDGTSMVHEMFRFEQSLFSLERVIKIVNAVSNKFLGKEPPTAFLSTQKGETYPSLDMAQARKVYQRYRGQVSFLLFGVNHSVSGRTFSLMFQFEAPGQEPYGSLSMMWGQEDTHRMIRAVIWEQLQLRPYQEDGNVALQKAMEESEQEPEQMTVSPLFQGRGFEVKPRTALVVMPMEAYWSETMWVHIQQTLKAMGWDSLRAEALFSEDQLEDTWEKMNEVELMVADLTYKHPDVFYKIGVWHTLGKSVILVSQHERDIPPDFLRFPHIIYDNNIHGLQQLAGRLVELVRKGDAS